MVIEGGCVTISANFLRQASGRRRLVKFEIGEEVYLLVVMEVGVEILSFGAIELTLVQNIKRALVGHLGLLSINKFMKFSYEVF